ncbi:MAG: ABC transporter ATP-binding protein [Lentisphaeria bacterium]|nr:ABC transporter ATP-binding protein [Lentisphaeria bacterium]
MKIETENLFFSYGDKELLKGISLTLEPGRFTVLLGPNGCGKSTLLKLLTGELRPDSGEVKLAGRPVREYPGRERAQCLGVVLQSAPPAMDFTVGEYVLTGRNARMSPFAAASETDRKVVWDALKLFQVEHLSDRRCTQLSGGERQRMMLAAARVAEPEIYLLDEATSATDPAHTFAILKILREWARTKTVFMITHDLILAGNFAERIILMKEGRIYADGTPQEVMTENNLRKVYNLQVSVSRAPNGALAILPEMEKT